MEDHGFILANKVRTVIKERKSHECHNKWKSIKMNENKLYFLTFFGSEKSSFFIAGQIKNFLTHSEMHLSTKLTS